MTEANRKGKSMDLKTFLTELAGTMSLDGYEYTAVPKLKELFMPYFDECIESGLGGCIFVRHSSTGEKYKLMLDAHIDEVGMMVKSVDDDGMLTICGVGLDARILPCTDVIVYGKESIPGVVCPWPSKPQKPADAENLVPVSDLAIDTGLPAEKLRSLVRVGTPVGFKPVYTALGNNKIAGKAFDDKACAVVPARAVEMLGDNVPCEIYVSLSPREEATRVNGALAASDTIEPDAAIVIDVNFAMAPEGKPDLQPSIGSGASLTVSTILDREWTRLFSDTAKEINAELLESVCPTSTGTNAVAVSASGVPTADIGIPLLFMHTQNEVVSTDDIETTARLIAAVITKKFGGDISGFVKPKQEGDGKNE